MLRFLKYTCIALCLVFTVTLSSCLTNNPTEDAAVDPTDALTVEYVINEIYSDADLIKYCNHIRSIKYQPPLVPDLASYFQSPEECARLYEIGLKGVPALIYETSNTPFSTTTNPDPEVLFQTAYQMYGAVALLRLHDVEISFNQNPRACQENFYNIYTEAKKQCPSILLSSKSTTKKAEELRYYGIFAIPYILKSQNVFDKVLDNDSAREMLLEKYCIEIGLHLSTVEFMEIIDNHEHSFEEQYEVIKNHPKAEDFDYKVWLSENEEDLDNLFKFLDAYCAEYEAEMAKG